MTYLLRQPSEIHERTRPLVQSLWTRTNKGLPAAGGLGCLTPGGSPRRWSCDPNRDTRGLGAGVIISTGGWVRPRTILLAT
jgi:hypothetical protein